MITRIQAPNGNTNAVSGTAFSITLTATAAGEAIFVMAFWGGGTPTIADNKTNTYVLDASGTTTEHVGIWSCLNPTSGVTSVTITPAAANFSIAFVASYRGLLAASAFDKTSYHANLATTTYTSNATTTLASSSELCLGIAGTGQSSNATIAASGSWTNPVAHTGNTGDGDDARWQQQIVNAVTGLAATGTNVSVTRLHALIATYRAAPLWVDGLMCNVQPQDRIEVISY